MPREDRRIHFENEEVYKAIYAMCFQKQLRLPPPGHVTKVVGDPNTRQIIIHLSNPQDKSDAKLEYAEDFVAAALMLFCRGCGIPLPKTASKSVQVTDGVMILRVQK